MRFSVNRDEVQRMEHYFNRIEPIILNENNIDTLNHLLNQFIDEVKGEIEAWFQRGSGWVIDEILEAPHQRGTISPTALWKLYRPAKKPEKKS